MLSNAAAYLLAVVGMGFGMFALIAHIGMQGRSRKLDEYAVLRLLSQGNGAMHIAAKAMSIDEIADNLSRESGRSRPFTPPPSTDFMRGLERILEKGYAERLNANMVEITAAGRRALESSEYESFASMWERASSL